MVNVYNLRRVKIVLTTMLTVMSGMDPHMINWVIRCDLFGQEMIRFY
jgi:hypothetical protein